MNERLVSSARVRLRVAPVLGVLLLLFGGPVAEAQNHQPPGDFFERLLQEFGRKPDFGREQREFLDSDKVEQTAGEVFSSPEFRALPHLNLKEGASSDSNESGEMPWGSSEATPKPEPIAQGSGALATFLSGLVGGVATILVVMLAIVLAGGLAAILFFVVRTWQGSEAGSPVGDDAADESEPEPLVAPGKQSADAWLAAARAAAAAGRFEEAISLLLLGAMGHAERAGFIRFRRGLTHRDYLRNVPRDSAWHGALGRLIRTYAPIGFGRREASVQTFEEVLVPYEAALAAEPLVVAGGPEA